MICRADKHYDVVRNDGHDDHIRLLRCKRCAFSVNVKALHKAGDKSGAGRYCRARAKMVKHWHAEHRETNPPEEGFTGSPTAPDDAEDQSRL